MNSEQPIRFEVSPKRVRALVGGETVADSLVTALMLETGYQPIYYFPREDVDLDLLVRSEHHTHRPLKGGASCWHARGEAGRIENAAWSYEEPTPEAEAIRDHIAFY